MGGAAAACILIDTIPPLQCSIRNLEEYCLSRHLGHFERKGWPPAHHPARKAIETHLSNTVQYVTVLCVEE